GMKADRAVIRDLLDARGTYDVSEIHDRIAGRLGDRPQMLRCPVANALTINARARSALAGRLGRVKGGRVPHGWGSWFLDVGAIHGFLRAGTMRRLTSSSNEDGATLK